MVSVLGQGKGLELAEKAVDVLIGYFRKEGVIVYACSNRLRRRFLEDRGYLKAAPLGTDFYEAQRRTTIEDYNEQCPPDDADEYALVLALVHNRRECVFTDQPRHRARRSHISRGQARKTGRVHVTNVAVKGNRLTITIYQEHHASSAFNAQAVKNTFKLMELVFLQYERRFCHVV
jgi:hypothetical protein